MVFERLGAGAGLALREESDLGSRGVRETIVHRDSDGSPLAFGAVVEGDYRIRFPGLATFAFRPGAGEIRFSAETDTARAVAEDLLRTAALPLLLQAEGYEAIHASAVQTAAGVIAFCGVSGAGKTTMAYGLARRGHPLWADDVVLFLPRPDPEVVLTVRAPHAVNLRSESAGFFGADDERPISTANTTSDRLAAVVALDRRPDAAADTSRLPLDAALTAVLPHAFCFFAEPGRQQATVRAYLDLVARVPVLRFQPPTGFTGFDAALDRLEASLRDTLGRL